MEGEPGDRWFLDARQDNVKVKLAIVALSEGEYSEEDKEHMRINRERL